MEAVQAESLIEQTPEGREEYLRLSQRAGGTYQKPYNYEKETKFLRFLQEHEIVVYPYDQVKAYMNDLMKQLNWGTFARGFNTFFGHKFEWYWLKATNADSDGWILYKKAIPVHALRKMALLREEYGTEVTFHISDYSVTRPDPFLRVTFLNQYYIIDKWDEPGFKLK